MGIIKLLGWGISPPHPPKKKRKKEKEEEEEAIGPKSWFLNQD